MKNITRFLSLILAILMLLPVMACANNEDNTAETTADENATQAEEITTVQIPIAQKDYNGDTFNVMYCSDIYAEDDYFAGEKTTGERVPDMVFEREGKIKEQLNVTITREDGGTYTQYYPKLQKAIKSGDDVYQLVMTHPYMSIGSMLSKGDIMSFNNLTTINLEADYWNSSLMEELSVDDKMFLGYNNFCLASCYLIVYNKGMYANHTDFNDPYEMVDNYEWTLDKLIEMSNSITHESEDDAYGFTGFCWVPFVSFLTSSGVKIVDKKDGEMYVSMDEDYNLIMIDLCDKLKAFNKSSSTFLYDYKFSGEYPKIVENQTLFTITNNRNLTEYQESETKVGLLPYPMFDANQKEYKTLNWNGYLVIPSNITNIEMVSDTIELLAFFSDDVKTAYFEVLLGARIAEAPEDSRMLDIIWAGQTSDLGLVFSSIGSNAINELLYLLPTVAYGNQEYTSYYKQHSKTAVNGLKKFKIKAQ